MMNLLKPLCISISCKAFAVMLLLNVLILLLCLVAKSPQLGFRITKNFWSIFGGLSRFVSFLECGVGIKTRTVKSSIVRRDVKHT